MTKMSTPIEHFKKEAKNLFSQVKASDVKALERVSQVLKDSSDISLMRIQHVIAIENGFLKWEDLTKTSAVELYLVITMKRVPQLNNFGIGVYGGDRGLSKEERDAVFEKNRKALRESVELVAATIGWLQLKVKPIETLNQNLSSYSLKHLAEKDLGYITNGVFIAAAIIAGYPYKIIDDGPNVIFGMSKKSVKEINTNRRSNESAIKSTGTPIGNFLRGPGLIPSQPQLLALADMFDKMTLEEQRLHLDEDARFVGLVH